MDDTGAMCTSHPSATAVQASAISIADEVQPTIVAIPLPPRLYYN